MGVTEMRDDGQESPSVGECGHFSLTDRRSGASIDRLTWGSVTEISFGLTYRDRPSPAATGERPTGASVRWPIRIREGQVDGVSMLRISGRWYP